MSENRRKVWQLALFVITVATTTFAGAEWIWGRFLFWGDVNLSWSDFQDGLSFSLPFLLILTCHEFGHYFTARYHQIQVSLPYYIPFWFGFALPMPSIGTMGAFIRIREAIVDRTKYFDVGISGPIAGFVVALGVLWYGFTHLPPTEYIYGVHPEYELFGGNFEEAIAGMDSVVHKSVLNPQRYNYDALPDSVYIGDGALYFGDNLLMMLGRTYLAPDDRYVPSSREIMHYPWLLAGYLALFFTALNLLPIGQLDGGHVTFGLFGPVWHQRISSVLFVALLFYAGLGWVKMEHLVDTSWQGVLGFLFQIAVYMYVMYLCAYSLIKEPHNRWVFASIMLAVQFVLSSYLGWEGYRGWLLFGLILGRFIGIGHPPVMDNRPLTFGRKVLGWLALIIFILCVSPEPMVVEY